MSAPVSGNQYFTNVENLLGSLTQLNVANLKSGGDALVASNFSANGVVLNVTPNLKNLTVESGGLTDGDALEANYAYFSGFSGAAATVGVTLPVALAGSSVVIIQDTAYTGTFALTVTTTTPTGGSQDVFAAGQKLLSTDGANGLSVEAASAGTETVLTYTPTVATTNLFGDLSRLVFTCVKTGEWNVTQELQGGLTFALGSAATGTFGFS